MIKALVQRGCDINLSQKNGRTALDYAIYFKRPYTIEFLRSRGGVAGIKENQDFWTDSDLLPLMTWQFIFSILFANNKLSIREHFYNNQFGILF